MWQDDLHGNIALVCLPMPFPACWVLDNKPLSSYSRREYSIMSPIIKTNMAFDVYKTQLFMTAIISRYRWKNKRLDGMSHKWDILVSSVSIFLQCEGWHCHLESP